ADQHRPLGDLPMRDHARDWIDAALATSDEPSDAPAESVLRAFQESRFIQGRDRAGILPCDAVDQSVMPVPARQQRSRAVVAESLVGGTVGRAGRPHARDEQALSVVVSVHLDAQRGTY